MCVMHINLQSNADKVLDQQHYHLLRLKCCAVHLQPCTHINLHLQYYIVGLQKKLEALQLQLQF